MMHVLSSQSDVNELRAVELWLVSLLDALIENESEGRVRKYTMCLKAGLLPYLTDPGWMDRSLEDVVAVAWRRLCHAKTFYPIHRSNAAILRRLRAMPNFIPQQVRRR
jgi:hypothetical protein